MQCRKRRKQEKAHNHRTLIPLLVSFQQIPFQHFLQFCFLQGCHHCVCSSVYFIFPPNVFHWHFPGCYKFSSLLILTEIPEMDIPSLSNRSLIWVRLRFSVCFMVFPLLPANAVINLPVCIELSRVWDYVLGQIPRFMALLRVRLVVWMWGVR